MGPIPSWRGLTSREVGRLLCSFGGVVVGTFRRRPHLPPEREKTCKNLHSHLFRACWGSAKMRQNVPPVGCPKMSHNVPPAGHALSRKAAELENQLRILDTGAVVSYVGHM